MSLTTNGTVSLAFPTIDGEVIFNLLPCEVVHWSTEDRTLPDYLSLGLPKAAYVFASSQQSIGVLYNRSLIGSLGYDVSRLIYNASTTHQCGGTEKVGGTTSVYI